MIYTLTLNTAIDLNLTCERISPDKVNRVSQTNYSPNGKAVNVSIVLEHFGLKSVAMGIFGGFTGQYILDCLEKRGIQTLPFFIEDITRINVFVNDKEKEYKFVGKGGHVSHLTQQAILNSVNEITDMECLIISGSLPPGIDASFLEQLLSICTKRHIEIILDISHPDLSKLLKYKPLLIKPNNEELNEIFGLCTNPKRVIDSIETIHSLGAQNILLTMGADGMYFSNGESIHFCNAPKIEPFSSACAGDSSLAAFLSIWLYNKQLISEAMMTASAVGADVAASAGIGSLTNYPQLKEQLITEKIC